MKTKLTPFIVTRANGVEMINYYVNIFNDSEVLSLEYYNDLEHGEPNDLLNGHVRLFNQEFFFMDLRDKYNPNGDYTENFLVEVCNKEEFNQYFEALKEGGIVMMGPEALLNFELCTWLKDKYGITWQLVLKYRGEALLNKVHEALEIAKNTSDFKTYFKTLKTIGISYYNFDITSGYTFFVTTDGEKIKDNESKTDGSVISSDINIEAAKDVVKNHTPGSDFVLFTKTLASFGIAYWKTDFINNKVMYHNTNDEVLFSEEMK